MSKVYYTTATSPSLTLDTQIIPAPQISLSTAVDYASDNNNVLVGHKHIITLTGFATAYRKTSENDTDQAQILRKVSENIDKIRKLLSKMGYSLYVVENESNVLVATGGKLISFEVTESPNNWKSYANYTATIEFQSINYTGDDYSCLYSIFSNSTTTNAVDISKYKIKDYNENYELVVGDEIYNRIRNIDNANDLNIENISLNLTYTVSATGRHFFKNDQLLPAWEQAKNFVQHKIYTRVQNLTNVLEVTSPTACGATNTLPNIQTVPTSEGLIDELQGTYQIFNEEISCSSSEAEGTFSATYKCILKRHKTTKYINNNTIHTFTKNIQYSKDNNKITTISIDGNIQGLMPGGIIFLNSGSFTLPAQGNLFIAGTQSLNKYTTALATLNLILNLSGDDLSDNFKSDLGINAEALGVKFSGCSQPADALKAASFNLTHNPFDGTISYNATYSSNLSCDPELANISISVNEPTKVYATFEIPGAEGTSNVGTVLQNIGTQTSRTIDITIQGINPNLKRCGLTPATVNSIYGGICQPMVLPASIISKLPNPDLYILKTKQKTTNLVDGSYNITLGYICNPGCDL